MNIYEWSPAARPIQAYANCITRNIRACYTHSELDNCAAWMMRFKSLYEGDPMLDILYGCLCVELRLRAQDVKLMDAKMEQLGIRDSIMFFK